jgi:hypothetical protein
MEVFNSFDKDNLMIKRAFIVISCLFIVGMAGGYLYMVQEIRMANDSIVVVDSDNATFIGHREIISRDRREGQLRKHVEMFLQYFWNVSQEADMIEKSVNRSLMLSDESGLQLYEYYYEQQALANWLLKNSGRSMIYIEDIQIDMSSYPYSGYVIAVNELESPTGISRRNMNMTFKIKDYPVSYENVVGALMVNIEVKDDKTIGNE